MNWKFDFSPETSAGQRVSRGRRRSIASVYRCDREHYSLRGLTHDGQCATWTLSMVWILLSPLSSMCVALSERSSGVRLSPNETRKSLGMDLEMTFRSTSF